MRQARSLAAIASPERQHRATCGACGQPCSGAGDMLCVECLPMLPAWARRLYMACWRSWQGKLIPSARMLSVRDRCVAAVKAQLTPPTASTCERVLAVVRESPGLRMGAIAARVGGSYRAVAITLSRLRRNGLVVAELDRPGQMRGWGRYRVAS